MRVTRVLVGLAVAGLLVACGQGAGATGPSSPAPGSSFIADLPRSTDDFKRLCETSVGFTASDTYAPGPGLHPVVLLEGGGEPTKYADFHRTLPGGWTLEPDADSSSNAEFAAIQLVACARLIEQTAGETCEFNGDAGGPPKRLTQMYATYELKLYEAKTGKAVGEAQTLVGQPTDCPDAPRPPHRRAVHQRAQGGRRPCCLRDDPGG
jgi:hypothetical protein